MTLSHYRIVSKIGAGGMGEVYLAEDTQLRRRIALKVLPADIAKDKDRLMRFEQEAFAASALNHPNILTIYEFGAEGETHYLAAEFIDGETLRDRLQRAPLALNEALEIVVQTAQALAAAHTANIIHRDIKPENVMIRKDGIVKVLDFGLAKLVEPAPLDAEGETRNLGLTQAGTVMGTVAYMSPEQARGNAVDPRTDIFSLGAMLYEMLAGRQPFTGETVNHVIVAILEQEPPPLAHVVSLIPSELERMLRLALAKNVNERYESVQTLVTDLRKLQKRLEFESELERSSPSTQAAEAKTVELQQTTAAQPETPVTATGGAQRSAPGGRTARNYALIALAGLLVLVGGYSGYRYFTDGIKQIESIAVLPFVNTSGNADIDYLSDGMTETLISSLAQLPKLNVKARSTVFRYKGKEYDLAKIAAELKVQAILTGRVAQRGDQLTLSLELVDTQTDNSLWSEQYNRKQADLVSLQSEIARDVSSKLKTKLSGVDEQKLAKKYTDKPEAYKLYLQGLFYANKRTTKDTRKAVEDFEKAVALDPNYALAYAGLADAQMFYTIYGNAPASDTFPKAREMALKALRLDNDLAEAHSTLGVILFFQDHDFAGWEREVKRALELNPNFGDGHRRDGLRLLWLGRFDEALIAFERSLEVEPLSVPTNRNYAECLYYLGRYEESEARTKKTLELDPNFWYSHYLLFNIHRMKGSHNLAIEPFARAQELRGAPETAKSVRESFARGGWGGFLRAMTSETSAVKVSPYDLATFHTELGKKDKAFATLNEAFEKRDHFLPFVKIDPFLKTLHADPRFQELLRRVGFP